MTSATVKPPNEPAVKAGSGFRPDIQGLRAIAVGLVLLYHAGVTWLPGGYVGVDVFFVISGFLITGMLVRQSLEKGRIDLADFYARRIRRILPAATIVLVFVAVFTLVLLPRTRWESIGTEIVGSALYLVNWVFADGTDYLDAGSAASPLQHFWTLAVEEQFYIVWPALLIGLLWLAHLGTKHPADQDAQSARIQRFLQIGVGLVIVPSFIWSIYYTQTNPAPAYFVTTTRLWELAIGAAIAIFVVYLEKLPHQLGYILQGGGLVAILAAGLFYSDATSFPGYAALLPTLGAAAVIIGGMSGRATEGFAVVLNVRPMRWVGDLSYSLYLWHWPLIVFATYFFDGTLPVWAGLIVVVLAVVPSWLSYRYVEQPFRDWQRLKEKSVRALRAGASLMVATAACGLIILFSSHVLAQQNTSTTAGDGPQGAEIVEAEPDAVEPVKQAESINPDVTEAQEDLAVAYEDGCHVDQVESGVKSCVYGNEDSDYVVAVVGDSHATHWVPALEKIAEENDWRLETYTKSACALSTVAVNYQGSFYESCYDWNQQVMEELVGADAPDHVIVSAASYPAAESSDVPDGVNTGKISEGLGDAWTKLQDDGVGVTAILDTPRLDLDVPECVAENPEDLTECSEKRSDALEASAHEDMQQAAETSDTEAVDLTDMFCSSDSCSAVIGDVLVWRDQHHMTATYSESLTSSLQRELREESSLVFAD